MRCAETGSFGSWLVGSGGYRKASCLVVCLLLEALSSVRPRPSKLHCDFVMIEAHKEICWLVLSNLEFVLLFYFNFTDLCGTW